MHSHTPATTVPVRPATSVIIVRDGVVGPEVFVQHRVQTMDFAAGAVVFPGGRVDPVDYRAAEAVASAVRPTAWERGDMASVPDHARVLVATAVREVAEETGANLPAGSLFPWANWVTPPGPPKRFDTYFFVTTAAGTQNLRNTTTEAKLSEWLPVATVLERGSLHATAPDALQLMRPTRTLLEELHGLGTASAIMEQAAGRTILPVRNDRPSR